MPPADPSFADRLRAAEAHLAAAAPAFAEVIARVGPCTLSPEPNVFRALVRAVLAQLISTAAARSITGRLETALQHKITPARLAKLTDDQLKACGISGGKAKALRGLAEHFTQNRRFAAELAAADDLGVRGLLLPLHGIGPWTVDMLLIFAFCHLDVLPVGDLGLRAGAKDLFGLAELPGPKELTALAEPWRPYRTVATWYLWRNRGWTGSAV